MANPARLTVFRTPVVSHLLGWFCGFWLWVFRWTIDVDMPDGDHRVLVIAPHTSYWDAPVLLAAGARIRIDPHWMGTHNLFRFPFRTLARWLGGVPVDRTRRMGLVDSAVEAFDQSDRLVLAIAPEGTRYRVDRWKTGFYRIAEGAEVPISLVAADYGRRIARIGGTFRPSGDYEADMAHVRAFYDGVTPRRPDRWAPPA